jgi:predicted amidohydrolase
MFIISAIQFRPNFATCQADIGNNYRVLTPLLDQAVRTGSELIVLPELCLSGYSFLSREEAARVAEPFDGKTFRVMRTFAVQANAYISWGYPEFDPQSGKMHNSGTMISPDGEIVTRYRKINLYSSDYLWASPGEEIAPIVNTKFGETSMIICRDLRDKIPNYISRFASEGGKKHYEGRRIDLVAASTNWGKGGFPSATWMEFVAQNKCTLVISNRWGVENNNGMKNDFGLGGSAIIESDWKVNIDGIKFNQDCVVTAIIL